MLATENQTAQRLALLFAADKAVPAGTQFHIPALGGICTYSKKVQVRHGVKSKYHSFMTSNAEEKFKTLAQLGGGWKILTPADAPWWECDVGQDDWVQYPADVSQRLEEAHSSGEAREVPFSRGGQNYAVVFNGSDMPTEQTNVGTRVTRPIRRSFSPGAGTIALPDDVPPYWQDDQDFQRLDARERIVDLQEKMQASIMPGTTHGMENLRVRKVERIENKDLWRDYQRKRATIQSRRQGADGHTVLADKAAVQRWLASPVGEQYPRVIEDAENNELWLWHGTNAETAPTIAQWGFDERQASMDGMYGAGNYFADNSSKSHQYSRGTNEHGHHCMFLCRVAMGTPYLTERLHNGERRPPPNPTRQGQVYMYDSIFAETRVAPGFKDPPRQVHNEYIVFSSAQVYPEFLIWYTVVALGGAE